MVIFFSLSSSTVLLDIIAGTLQPIPTIKGIKDLPLNPIFLKKLSNKNVILDIYPLVSRRLNNKNKITN